MTSTLKVDSSIVQLGSQGQAVKDLQVLLNQTVAAKLLVNEQFLDGEALKSQQDKSS
jgi:hypothetical protein